MWILSNEYRMLKKFRNNILYALAHPGRRTYIAFYFSFIVHLFLLIFALLPLIPEDELFCGIEDEPEIKELNIEFDLANGDFDLNDLPPNFNMGIQKKQENKAGQEGDKETQEKGKFDTSKYKKGEWKDLVQNLEATKDLRKNFAESYDNIFPEGIISPKYIKRFRHFEDMVVKDVFPTINSIEKDFSEEITLSEEVLENHNIRNEIIEDFRNQNEEERVELEISKNVNNKKNPKKPILKMSKEERDSYFDSSLTKSKENQLSDFLDKFAGYDPQEGDLPLVFRDLYYKNLQRLAYGFSNDTTYFTADYFEENLNKEDYLRNSMALASKYKGKKTSTEILFSILDIYEIQQRAIEEYYKNLEIQKNLSPKDKNEIRNETIRLVLKKYSSIFKDKNINSIEDIHSLYFKKIVSLTDFMLKNSNDSYRKKDILFERGRIYWENAVKQNKIENFELAINEWKKIEKVKSNGDFLNEETYLSIKPYLSDYNQYITTIINQIAPQNRLKKHLDSKREREEKLLWPK
jgi:hypothetical protein